MGQSDSVICQLGWNDACSMQSFIGNRHNEHYLHNQIVKWRPGLYQQYTPSWRQDPSAPTPFGVDAHTPSTPASSGGRTAAHWRPPAWLSWRAPCRRNSSAQTRGRSRRGWTERRGVWSWGKITSYFKIKKLDNVWGTSKFYKELNHILQELFHDVWGYNLSTNFIVVYYTYRQQRLPTNCFIMRQINLTVKDPFRWLCLVFLFEITLS